MYPCMISWRFLAKILLVTSCNHVCAVLLCEPVCWSKQVYCVRCKSGGRDCELKASSRSRCVVGSTVLGLFEYCEGLSTSQGNCEPTSRSRVRQPRRNAALGHWSQAKPNMEKSTVVDNASGKSVPSNIRTSSGTFLGRGSDAVVTTIEEKIAEASHIPVGKCMRARACMCATTLANDPGCFTA